MVAHAWEFEAGFQVQSQPKQLSKILSWNFKKSLYSGTMGGNPALFLSSFASWSDFLISLSASGPAWENSLLEQIHMKPCLVSALEGPNLSQVSTLQSNRINKKLPSEALGKMRTASALALVPCLPTWNFHDHSSFLPYYCRLPEEDLPVQPSCALIVNTKPRWLLLWQPLLYIAQDMTGDSCLAAPS